MATMKNDESNRSRKLFRLATIILVMSFLSWSYWGLITLRNSPCGWVNRIGGSGCLWITPREIDLGGEKVYFSRDNHYVYFLDEVSVVSKPVETRAMFTRTKLSPVLSREVYKARGSVPSGIDGFALNLDEMNVVTCMDFQDSDSNFKGVLVYHNLDNVNTPDVFIDVERCMFSEMDLIPSSSTATMNSSENGVSKVLFYDVMEDTPRTLLGKYWGSCTDNTDSLAVRESDQVISLYSFPSLTKLSEFEFPSYLRIAQVSPSGNNIFASSSHDSKIFMLDVTTSEIVHIFTNPDCINTETISISPNEQFMAAAFTSCVSNHEEISFAREEDFVINVWNLQDKTLVEKILLMRHPFMPLSLDLSSNGKLLAVGTWDYVFIIDLTK